MPASVKVKVVEASVPSVGSSVAVIVLQSVAYVTQEMRSPGPTSPLSVICVATLTTAATGEMDETERQRRNR